MASLVCTKEVFLCVGIELFSRSVSRQVFWPQQSLTSVFGMGTGGPSALETLTRSRFSVTVVFDSVLSIKVKPLIGCRHCLLVHLQGFEPGTH